MKRVFSLLLAGILSLNLIVPAFAASDKATNAADALYELGLSSGTGTDADGNPIYELDRAPTRHEAVTMLVGLLGKKQEALNGTWIVPFTDVANWAKPFVGYAYTNGLTAEPVPASYTVNGIPYDGKLGTPVLGKAAAELAHTASSSTAAKKINNVGDAFYYMQAIGPFEQPVDACTLDGWRL